MATTTAHKKALARTAESLGLDQDTVQEVVSAYIDELNLIIEHWKEQED